MVATIAIEKDVDLDYVAPEEKEDLYTIADSAVVTVDRKTGNLLVSEEASLADILAALKLADGVTVEMFDELGNYIPAEFYEVATGVAGFTMELYKDGVLADTLTFAYGAAADDGEGEGEGDNVGDNTGDDNKPEDDKPEDDKTEDEDSDNTDTGVTSVAAIMIVLMAGAAVALLALRRRKVTE